MARHGDGGLSATSDHSVSAVRSIAVPGSVPLPSMFSWHCTNHLHLRPNWDTNHSSSTPRCCSQPHAPPPPTVLPTVLPTERLTMLSWRCISCTCGSTCMSTSAAMEGGSSDSCSPGSPAPAAGLASDSGSHLQDHMKRAGLHRIRHASKTRCFEKGVDTLPASGSGCTANCPWGGTLPASGSGCTANCPWGCQLVPLMLF